MQEVIIKAKKYKNVHVAIQALSYSEIKMGRQGFEPWKAEPTDLQSAPFDRSGISPYR